MPPPPLGGLLAEIQKGKTLKQAPKPVEREVRSVVGQVNNGVGEPRQDSKNLQTPPGGSGLMAELMLRQKRLTGKDDSNCNVHGHATISQSLESPKPSNISNQRQGPPPVLNQRQVPPPMPNQRQGPPPMPNQRQVPPPMPNQRQGPPPISDQRQGPPPIPNQRQGPPPIPDQRQGPPPLPNQRQGPPPLPNQRQGPPPLPNQRQGPPPVPNQRQGPPPVPNQRQGPPPVPNQRQGPPPVPNQRQGPPPVPNQRQGPPQVPNQRQGPPPVPNQRQIPPPVPNQRQGPPPVPNQRQIPPPIPAQSQGSTTIHDQEHGLAPTASEHPKQTRNREVFPITPSMASSLDQPTTTTTQERPPPASPLGKYASIATAIQTPAVESSVECIEKHPTTLKQQLDLRQPLHVSIPTQETDIDENPKTKKKGKPISPTKIFGRISKLASKTLRRKSTPEGEDEQCKTQQQSNLDLPEEAKLDVNAGNFTEAPEVSSGGEATKSGEQTLKAAVVKFDFVAENEDELSCSIGDILYGEVAPDDEEWFHGALANGSDGLVPLSYIQIQSERAVVQEQAAGSTFQMFLECLLECGLLQADQELFSSAESASVPAAQRSLDSLKHLRSKGEVRHFVQQARDPRLLAMCTKMHLKNGPGFNQAACSRVLNIHKAGCRAGDQVGLFHSLLEDFVEEPLSSEINTLFQLLGAMQGVSPTILASRIAPALFRDFSIDHVMEGTKAANKVVELVIRHYREKRKATHVPGQDLGAQGGVTAGVPVARAFEPPGTACHGARAEAATHPAVEILHVPGKPLGSSMTTSTHGGRQERHHATQSEGTTDAGSASQSALHMKARQPPPPPPPRPAAEVTAAAMASVTTASKFGGEVGGMKAETSAPLRSVECKTVESNSDWQTHKTSDVKVARSRNTVPSTAGVDTEGKMDNNTGKRGRMSLSKALRKGMPPRRPSGSGSMSRTSIVPTPSMTKVDVPETQKHQYSCPPPAIRRKPVV